MPRTFQFGNNLTVSSPVGKKARVDRTLPPPFVLGRDAIATTLGATQPAVDLGVIGSETGRVRHNIVLLDFAAAAAAGGQITGITYVNGSATGGSILNGNYLTVCVISEHQRAYVGGGSNLDGVPVGGFRLSQSGDNVTLVGNTNLGAKLVSAFLRPTWCLTTETAVQNYPPGDFLNPSYGVALAQGTFESHGVDAQWSNNPRSSAPDYRVTTFLGYTTNAPLGDGYGQIELFAYGTPRAGPWYSQTCAYSVGHRSTAVANIARFGLTLVNNPKEGYASFSYRLGTIIAPKPPNPPVRIFGQPGSYQLVEVIQGPIFGGLL